MKRLTMAAAVTVAALATPAWSQAPAQIVHSCTIDCGDHYRGQFKKWRRRLSRPGDAMRNLVRGFPAFLLVAALACPCASAEPYPSQRLTLIVPFPPGSATDSVTRHLAESIRGATNVAVVVENKPGADGNLAALAVLKAEPDGYTAFVTTNSTQAANASLFNSLPYDPKADFAPVAGIMTIPMMLAVRPDFPARDVAEFVELAKKREKPLSFGSGNTSSRRALQVSRGNPYAARTISRYAAGVDGRDQRANRLRVCRSCERAGPVTGWPAAGAGCHGPAAN